MGVLEGPSICSEGYEFKASGLVLEVAKCRV